MKKATNNIIASMVAIAVIGIATGYGITFWEHWRANQNAHSRTNSSPDSTRRISDPQCIEPSTLEAPPQLS
jgi:hypothetical protein